MVDHDTLSQGSGSFQFQSGDLYWHHDNGSYSTHLTGEIRLDDANGSCARMRLVYFDDGAELATKYGGTVCAEDGKAHSYSVDLNPYNGLHSWTVDLAPFTSTQIDDVYVAMETEGTNGSWNQVDNTAHTASDGAFLDAND